MAKPIIHARSSAKKMGGSDTDYIAIHDMMDSTKSIVGDNRHRVIFHTAFGIRLIEKIFGMDFSKLEQLKDKYGWSDEEVQDIIGWKQHCIENGTCIQNSDGRKVPVRDIGEQHCLEDHGMKYIPSLQDYIEQMEIQPWMSAVPGTYPASAQKLVKTDQRIMND